MLEDGKIPSNFNPQPIGPFSSRPKTGFEPIAMPFEEESYSSDDERSWERNEGGMQPMMPMPPVEKPKDYQAMAEARLYEMVSLNGAPREMNVNVSMFDDNNGHGRADVMIGKDVKKRRFEIPIGIKDGKITIEKAIDLDSDKVIDIDSGTQELFKGPDEEALYTQLDKTYDKYHDFFKGRLSDKKIKTLTKRYPSLDADEARKYLEHKHEDEKVQSMIFTAINQAKKHKKAIIVGLSIAAVVILAMIRRQEKSGQGR